METKEFTMQLAGVNIAVRHLYGGVGRYCAEFVCQEAPDFTVEITMEDIEKEREKAAQTDQKEGSPVQEYPNGYLEALAVHRKISTRLLSYNILLMHGSCIALDGQGYIFIAKSGTGKSTHTRLWREQFGDRAVMVNDDKPFLQITDKGVFAYGSPWNGKHRLGANIKAPLKAICVLQRGEENRIRRLTQAEAFPYLMQQVFRSNDRQDMEKLLELVEKCSQQVALYCLQCNMDPEAAQISYGGMCE